ncbi:MAG: oxidoreductase [Deltaproteobacteria bacterium]|nr:oxidoreductase [Deltaproteobacteria bacterium]
MVAGRLEGKRAIITGAASGIGRASAVRFAAEGAHVVAVDVSSEGLVRTVEEIERGGGRARAVSGDAADEAFVERVVASCVSDLGGLEVMFANAGIPGRSVPLLQLSAEDWLPVLKVNLIGAFLAIKYAARVMVAAGRGSVLCTASVAGLRSGAGASPYSASKAGIINLVQTAANALAGTGVRVNAICPGLIETGMTESIFAAARAAGKEHKIGQLNPLKRAGQPVEIADTALFLASDESSYVNGAVIVADGGLSSSHPVIPGRLG